MNEKNKTTTIGLIKARPIELIDPKGILFSNLGGPGVRDVNSPNPLIDH
jgi:hypothetical protein